MNHRKHPDGSALAAERRLRDEAAALAARAAIEAAERAAAVMAERVAALRKRERV